MSVDMYQANGTRKRFVPGEGWVDWQPDTDWRAFGIPDKAYSKPDAQGRRFVHMGRGGPKPPKDRPASWLRNAMISLAVLAIAAAVVSYAAQYNFVLHYKHSADIAYIQAGIPDIGALVFAALGIAMALQGKRALRPRALNLLCVGISIAMNFLAASAGFKAVAVWTMPSIIYALASDTLVGVIRAWTIARQKELRDSLADEGVTPLDVLGAFLLWLLRLSLAPKSTLTGFRGWVVKEVKVAPGTVAVTPAKPKAEILPRERKAITPPNGKGKGSRGPRTGSKTAQFLARVEEKYGPLAAIDLAKVSPIAQELCGDLDWGAARTALGKRIKAARAAGGQA